MSNGKQNRKYRDRDNETGSERPRQKGRDERQRYSERHREIVTMASRGLYDSAFIYFVFDTMKKLEFIKERL